MKIDENEELKPSQSEMQMITTDELELNHQKTDQKMRFKQKAMS